MSANKSRNFKQTLIDENDARYGKELREMYSDTVINASNTKVKGMSDEQWRQAESLRAEIETLLKAAFERGDPASETAQKVCDLHKQWLCLFWANGTYSKVAHKGLAEMYVADERFTAYYDKIVVGCAGFLRDAINLYCE